MEQHHTTSKSAPFSCAFALIVGSLVFAVGLGETAQAQPVAEDDSLALVAFYDATGGADWTDNSNWLTGRVSTWFGVEVDGERVAALRLPENNLEGEIPEEIGDLTDLDELDLSNNELTGELPDELGDLVELEILNLAENEFTDDIPDEWAISSSWRCCILPTAS